MKRYKGIVQNHVVVLEKDVQLPDGTEVEVCLPTKPKTREEAFLRLLNNPITRFIGIDQIIEEDKREREERWRSGGKTEP
jgi:hypothetical protein